MKKSRMLTWLTVLLCVVSVLGMPARAEEAEEYFEDPAPVVESVSAAPSSPEPEAQPQQPVAQEAANPPASGCEESQPAEQQQPKAADESKSEEQQPVAADNSPSGEQASDAPLSQEHGSAPQDSSDGSPDQEEAPAPAQNPVQYTVRFISPTGCILLAYEAEAGTAVEDPQLSPTMKGYAFSHWYKVGDGPENKFKFNRPIQGNLTIAAYFIRVKAAKPEAPKEEKPAEETPEQPPEEEPETVVPAAPALTIEDDETGAVLEPTPEPPAEAPEAEGEAPEDEEELELIDDDEEEVEVELEYILPMELHVTVTADKGTTVRDGDVVTMFASVEEDLTGLKVVSLWRYKNGESWVVDAVDTMEHSFTVDAKHFRQGWEFVITVSPGAEG